MSQTIPVPDGLPYFTIRTRLEDRDYTLEFWYSTRAERFYLSLLDERDNEQVPLVLGLKLVTNVPLLRYYKHRDGMPPGELMVTCSTPTDVSPPKLGELGTLDEKKRCQLTYFSAAEVLAAGG